MLRSYIAVMFIGAFGCGARMLLSNYLSDKYGPAFPIGTLVVNIAGCFIIGFFATLTRSEGALPVPPIVRSAVMIGFLGGFTTFSAFAFQTLALIGDGKWGYATLNVVLSVVLCMAAVWIGQVIALELTIKYL